MHRCLTNRTRHALFLCFHSVHPSGPPYLSITPDIFEQQIRKLARYGFVSGSLADLPAIATTRPDRPLAFVTFDDGFADNAEIALPILLEYRFRPIVFIVPSLIGSGSMDWPGLEVDQHRYPDVLRPLTWRQVDEMRAAGAEIGAHTMSHSDLPALDDDALSEELSASRAEVASRCGECTALAYPFGHWNLRVAKFAAHVGFRWGFTLRTSAQTPTTALTIPRVAVDHRDRRFRFTIKVSPVCRRLLLSRSFQRAERAGLRRRQPVAAESTGVT